MPTPPQPSALTDAERAGLFTKTSVASGLPPRAYFDSAWYENERRTVMWNTWLAVGFETDIPNAGDLMPVSVGGYELAIGRAVDGGLVCFHNVCRHRGMKLVTEKKNSRNVVCGWHCWTYDFKGPLLNTPHIQGIGVNSCPDFERSVIRGAGAERADVFGVHPHVGIGATGPNIEP